jgi:hypothetical protein
MPHIRIIVVPAGEAPLEIREAWVGVVLSYDPLFTSLAMMDSSVGVRSDGVLSREMVRENDPNEGGYAVHSQDAIAALRSRGRTEAAEWWDQLALSDCVLVFGQQFCEEVSDADLVRCPDCGKIHGAQENCPS